MTTDTTKSSKTSKTKTIEETYQKLSQREHVLHRPNMYIGEIKKTLEEMWVLDLASEKMTKRMVEYSPGFLKIFDEVLTNALDHSTRDASLDKIKVDFDKQTGEISVWNNGTGVPVVMHKEHNMYVPELIFGHLLAGSNYDDSQQRIGAGVNGLGVKLANIYSTSFTVETIDSESGQKFIQTFSNNMSDRSKAKVTKASSKSYTKISFIPDYGRFFMNGLEDDTVALIGKRVYDCIACTEKNVSIFLNGNKIRGKGLVDYSNYFFEQEKIKSFYDTFTQTVGKNELVWEYIVVPSDHFEQVSFVNGNSTYQGGKHVDHIVYQITSKLKGLLETKRKLKDVKPAIIKERLFLFLRSTVINPQFSSQTKEQLTTQVKDFGCRVEVTDKFIDKLYKSPIVEEIVEFCKMKESMDLAKTTDGKKKNKIYVPKLEDALWAGTAKSDQCSLILTEGLSAMTFALWGRSVVGPERLGVFPLKGKVLNIRDATVSQLMNNEEINNLKQIVGLKQGKDYKDTKDLRYGKIMILTDADVDGSHIKGLLVNLFHCWWPSLLKLDFIQTLRTPIVKAIRGQKVLEFYTEQDYNKWRETTNTKGYQIRYFKGLGTSKKEDAQETFRKIDRLRIDYYHKDNLCDESIVLAFEKDKNIKTKATDEETKNDTESNEAENDQSNKETITTSKTDYISSDMKCSDKRKRWLAQYDRNSYIDAKTNRVSYQDLIHKELIHFSIYDNLRSIPSLCDGLKPSQRKILYYMLKNNINKVIKVAQLSGYVSAETGYHHGEASLQGAIVSMAQNFVGSNNLNLLFPDGNFGSRLLGGKDAASPRYIFTRLSDVTNAIFDKRDSPLLKYLDDDGMQIEPEWFMPVLPMVLVNGCEGIGTGYSTYIPPYNPKDIIANLLRVLDDKEPLPMMPYFKNFHGNLRETEPGSYTTYGKWERVSDTQIKITELPVGSWVTTYKEFLESLVDSNTSKPKATKNNAGTSKTKKQAVQLKDVQNKTRDENSDICFVVEFCKTEDLDKMIKTNTLEKTLRLSRSFTTNNMYLFSDELILTKYRSATDILLDFYDLRIEFYERRKTYLVKQLQNELTLLNSKIRFINEYINGDLDINRRNKEYIVSLLEEKNYPKLKSDIKDDSENVGAKSFDYLVRMPLISLSLEKIQELEKHRDTRQNELHTLQNKSERDLWRDDLDEISRML
jgi:DNA topoisomerase-2